ncbi:AIPR family protein [Acuticoccus sp.]|uniref:AIPR family protein n=1 Tax=Acuticoccus sp. TaxID=1904378 RepID=UPI003B520C50
MDVVTQSLLREFALSQKIDVEAEADKFEGFINYIVVSDVYQEEFDFSVISTGKGEFGIDGVAIIVNDTIVDDEDQIDDIIEHHAVLQMQFVFVQSKTSSSFDAGDLSKFLQAATDFSNQQTAFVQSERIIELHRVKNKLYQAAAKFARGLPKLSLYYATTGTWNEDRNLCAIRDGAVTQLRSLHMFEGVAFHPVDATRIQKLYFQTKNAFRVTVSFGQNVSIPEIPDVRESYIGLLSIGEYLKMITDEEGAVRRRLFFDNIRDFQGDTPVNKSIAETLSSQNCIQFPLRNNGITIVTRKLQRVGSQFTLEDFQIVNGCQTSHVIVQTAHNQNNDTMIPVKIVATKNEDIIRQVIIASNQQNRVDQESFWALDPIHKAIEIYFESKPDDQRLFYERRPGQFNTVVGIEKVRIITKEFLLKVYASVYLEQPNQVGRYYKDLIPMIGTDIFAPTHEVHSYYTAAYMAYRLEFLFRNRRIASEWKAFRFQLVMAARLITERELGLDPTKKRSKTYCHAMDKVMLDPEKALKVFEEGCESITTAIKALKHNGAKLDRRTAKMRDMKEKLKAVLAESINVGSTNTTV